MSKENSIENKKTFLLFVYIVIAMVLFLVAKSYSSVGESGELSAEWLRVIYCVGELAVALGLLFYGFFFERIDGRVLYTLLTCLFAGGVIVMFIKPAAPLYIIGSCCELFSLGVVMGEMLYCAAINLRDSKYRFLILTGAIAVGFLLQFVLRGINDWWFCPVLLIALFLAVIFMGRNKEMEVCSAVKTDAMDGGNLSGTDDLNGESVSRTVIVRTCLLCAVLLMFEGLMDGQIMSIVWENGGTASIVYSWPRLMIIVGYMLVGIAVHLVKKINAVALILVVLPVIAVNQLVWAMGDHDESGMVIFISLFYLGLGVASSFYHISFMDLAVRSRYGRLWAGFGRVIDGIVTVGLSLFSGLLLKQESVIIAIALLWSAVVVLIFAHILENRNKSRQENVVQNAIPDRTEDEWIEIFSQEYGFTEREKDVFAKCVTTEDINDAMAQDLSISRRLLQKYIASIYEKTGCESRSGLVRKYYEVQKKAGQHISA